MPEIEIVGFTNAHGCRLVGTLHRPAVPRPDAPAVVLMSPGAKMRVGPGRLYLPLTDLLTARGHLVLRFDFFGLGDSEGELPEAMLADVYNQIEVGRFVDDGLAALRWMRETHGCQRFVVGGLCGGAITALLTAAQDPSVDGLLSIGMTVTLASDAARPAASMTQAEMALRRNEYLKRLWSPRAWQRFLTMKSPYGIVFRALLPRTFRRRTATSDTDAATALTAEQLATVNPLFPKAFFAFLERGGRALMLFGEKDRFLAEYRGKFAAPHARRLAGVASRIDKHVIPGANHELSHPEFRREMLAACERWLDGGRCA